MSDRRLRELERAAATSGSAADVEAYLLALRQARPLEAEEWYRLGAAQLELGRPAAERLNAIGVRPLGNPPPGDDERWRRLWANYRRLVREGNHYGPTTPLHHMLLAEQTDPDAILRRNLAAARHLLTEWEAAGWIEEDHLHPELYSALRESLEAALARLNAPGAIGDARLEELLTACNDAHQLLDAQGFDDHGSLFLAAIDAVAEVLCIVLPSTSARFQDPLVYVTWRSGRIRADRDPGGVVGALREIRSVYVMALLPWALGLGDPALDPLPPPPPPPEADPKAEARDDAIAAERIRDHLERNPGAKLRYRMEALRGFRPARMALPASRGLDRWDIFLPLIEAWYRERVGPKHGWTEDQVDAAEERLDLELPLVLWELYRLVGRRAKHWEYERLFRLETLDVEGDQLVFGTRGEQRYTVALDDLEQDSPPARLDGESVTDSLADLLQLMVFRDTVLLAAGGFRVGPLGRLQPFQRIDPPAQELRLLWTAGDQELRGDATTLVLKDGGERIAIARR